MRIGSVELGEQDLKTHIRIVGISQLGKTTLTYDILCQLIMEGQGFILIDPNKTLYERVLAFLTIIAPYRQQQVRLFDTSTETTTATIDPLGVEDNEKEIHTKAQTMATLTSQIWAAGRTQEVKFRVNKLMFSLFVALLEMRLPLTDAQKLLNRRSFDPGIIRNDFAREAWINLFSLKEIRFNEYIEPIWSRLLLFSHPHFKDLTTREQAINFHEVMTGNGIVLANLSSSRLLGHDENRTLAALMISQIWDTAFQHRIKKFYVFIDEFSMFATEEVAEIMAQAAKFNLHLIVIHQSDDQFQSKRVKSEMQNASTTIRFLEQGKCLVEGRGIGKSEVRLEQQPEPIITPYFLERVERYITSVRIEPKTVSKVAVVEEESYDYPSVITKPTDNIEIVREMRYATIQHIAHILKDTSPKYQNVARRLRNLERAGKLYKQMHDGKSVFRLDSQPSSILTHDLLISDFHAKYWDIIDEWQQTGLQDEIINPDAFYGTPYGYFYLEVENTNSRSSNGESAMLTKAKQFIEHATLKGHRERCQNFRVHYIRHSERMARNLAEKIAKSGIRHLGKFWISWGEGVAISPNGLTYSLTTGLTI